MDSTQDENIKQWHSLCDPLITFTPTTPTFAPLTRTLDPDACTAAADACYRWGEGIKSCKSVYTNATQALSCLCQPSQLLHVSHCLAGRTECNKDIVTITSSDIPEYNICPAVQV